MLFGIRTTVSSTYLANFNTESMMAPKSVENLEIDSGIFEIENEIALETCPPRQRR